jgi:Ca2+-binding EF-hand superfamily protein
LREHRDEIQVIFNAFDLDQNGTIDEDEMVTVLRTVICAPLSKKEIKAMYKELDAG